MARHVGGVSGIARVALETMRSTYQELPQMSETAARGAGELIVELVRLSLQELAGRDQQQRRRRPLVRVLAMRRERFRRRGRREVDRLAVVVVLLLLRPIRALCLLRLRQRRRL